jgi:hypothetical protein
MEHNGTCRMKEMSWQPTALLGQAAGCRPLEPVSLVSSTMLVPFISGSLWPANGNRMQHVSEGLLPFSCYFLLGFKDVEGKTGKSWEITNIPKPSTSESFHQHPPTSTNPTKQPQCHEYPQVAHSLTPSPWVAQACPCRSPLQPDENEQFAKPC